MFIANKIDMNLYKFIAEALHYKWDPIGISDVPHSIGEYDSYVPELYELICKNADGKIIFDYLWKIEVQEMGCDGNRAATLAFVDYLKKMSSKVDS
ncbi:hypothetical protein [Psychrobacter sp. DAB_AL43B]|uniref:hypothetical protein n=1 Tax=Psychrobacter sp. DAB_AL43B TaxID=1028416 RepID=UPI0009A76F89|nr:hypothetical protein [Psychrobacter sp. DAB_AL43B]